MVVAVTEATARRGTGIPEARAEMAGMDRPAVKEGLAV